MKRSAEPPASPHRARGRQHALGGMASGRGWQGVNKKKREKKPSQGRSRCLPATGGVLTTAPAGKSRPRAPPPAPESIAVGGRDDLTVVGCWHEWRFVRGLVFFLGTLELQPHKAALPIVIPRPYCHVG